MKELGLLVLSLGKPKTQTPATQEPRAGINSVVYSTLEWVGSYLEAVAKLTATEYNVRWSCSQAQSVIQQCTQLTICSTVLQRNTCSTSKFPAPGFTAGWVTAALPTPGMRPESTAHVPTIHSLQPPVPIATALSRKVHWYTWLLRYSSAIFASSLPPPSGPGTVCWYLLQYP